MGAPGSGVPTTTGPRRSGVTALPAATAPTELTRMSLYCTTLGRPGVAFAYKKSARRVVPGAGSMRNVRVSQFVVCRRAVPCAHPAFGYCHTHTDGAAPAKARLDNVTSNEPPLQLNTCETQPSSLKARRVSAGMPPGPLVRSTASAIPRLLSGWE